MQAEEGTSEHSSMVSISFAEVAAEVGAAAVLVGIQLLPLDPNLD